MEEKVIKDGENFNKVLIFISKREDERAKVEDRYILKAIKNGDKELRRKFSIKN